ncbi:MAG TPA: class I SAM-dependent methyltransferase [Candidatus Sulfotelmatobacter sp.]|nr:class I SAM-dependent methyltransferase [Candidatus Sulfotelmatobacter sp.]
MQTTDNFRKHTSKNPLKTFFLNSYYSTFLNELKKLEIKTVLDVGCGEGFILNKLKEEGIGKSWEGIDYSKEAVEIGKKIHPGLSLKQGSIYNSGLADSSFDLVVCTEVLEHLEDTKKALKEVLRISKKYVLLSVPNEPLFLFSNFTQWGKDIGHINHWTFWGFEKFVKENAGVSFKIIAKKYPFPWTMLVLQK